MKRTRFNLPPEQKIEKFKNEILKLFPGLDTSCLKYSTLSLGLEKLLEAHFYIPPENKNLINCPYFYNKKTVVHFSSIPALISILQEKAVRLYNLHNLNDPREFTFSSRLFGLDDRLVEDARTNIFLISFCEREILSEVKNEFNLWRLYGKNGKGIVIVFSIHNDPIYWRDFHLSEVFYGTKKREVFNELIDLVDNFNKTDPKITIDFGKLIPFHKSRLFELEKEVRLIYDRREIRAGVKNRTLRSQEKLIFPVIQTDLLKIIEQKDKVRYLRIPLYTLDNHEPEPWIPVLRIEQIIVGYNYVEEAVKIIDNIKELSQNSLGFIPIIKQTRLKNFYWDINKSQMLTRSIK
jgi:hypothetical protein